MKYNEKHDRYLDNDFNVYRWDKNKDKLVQCKLRQNIGYVEVTTKVSTATKLHRLIWETFVGEIPEGYEIDHINTIRNDNRLENLRCVTHKENVNNTLSKLHYSESRKGNRNRFGKPTSKFGNLFKERYGITRSENLELYERQRVYFHRTGRLK